MEELAGKPSARGHDWEYYSCSDETGHSGWRAQSCVAHEIIISVNVKRGFCRPKSPARTHTIASAHVNGGHT